MRQYLYDGRMLTERQVTDAMLTEAGWDSNDWTGRVSDVGLACLNRLVVGRCFPSGSISLNTSNHRLC
jgi:hypothetical protein